VAAPLQGLPHLLSCQKSSAAAPRSYKRSGVIRIGSQTILASLSSVGWAGTLRLLLTADSRTPARLGRLSVTLAANTANGASRPAPLHAESVNRGVTKRL